MKIVKCNIWGTDTDPALVELGIPETDVWRPFVIDFNRVSGIKLAAEHEFIGDDKAVLYFDGNVLTVDITFEEAIKIWQNESNNL